MRRLTSILLTLMLVLCFAYAEESIEPIETTQVIEPIVTAEPAETVLMSFDGLFALELPEGWQYYTVTDEMAASGVEYALSDADGRCCLYIQSWESDCADTDALLTLVQNAASPASSGKYSFNSSDFVVYDMVSGDVSCCATILNGRILNFVFTPQSDADFMVLAAQIIGSFTVL